MAYRSADQRDRWKAITGVAAVHVVLGAVIVTGLNVDIVRDAVDRLQSFDVTLEQPPPPEEPPPEIQQDRAQEPEGASGAQPSPIVAPEPRVPTENPIAAAPLAGTGASSSTGTGTSGTGPGAGGSGTGAGGGGTGAGNSPARLVRNLTRSDYRRLTGGRMPAGSAGLAIRIDRTGRIDSCRVEHSSGDPAIDAGLCPLVSARLRFQPARDAQGRPIPYYTNYLARWRR